MRALKKGAAAPADRWRHARAPKPVHAATSRRKCLFFTGMHSSIDDPSNLTRIGNCWQLAVCCRMLAQAILATLVRPAEQTRIFSCATASYTEQAARDPQA